MCCVPTLCEVGIRWLTSVEWYNGDMMAGCVRCWIRSVMFADYFRRGRGMDGGRGDGNVGGMKDGMMEIWVG